MLPERFSLKISTTFFVLLHIIRSDCLNAINKNEKINFNYSNVSVAVNLIIKSVNSSNIQVIGCTKYFHNEFDELPNLRMLNVSTTLLNVERKYVYKGKIPEKDFILIFVDQQFAECIQKFIENMRTRIRKHKMLVILKTMDCDDNW